MNDLIYRQEAIDALGERPVAWNEWADEYSLGQRNQYDTDKLAIETLPSAEPEKPFVIKINRYLKIDEREMVEKELYRKLSQQSLILLDPDMELVYPVRKGKWIAVHDPVFADTYYCSECKEEPLATDTEWVLSNFCPNCGADMRGDKGNG